MLSWPGTPSPSDSDERELFRHFKTVKWPGQWEAINMSTHAIQQVIGTALQLQLHRALAVVYSIISYFCHPDRFAYAMLYSFVDGPCT